MPLFPTFVWTHRLKPEDTTRVNDTIRTKLLSLLQPGAAKRKNFRHQTEQNLHTLPEFQEFNQYLRAATKGVMDFMQIAEEGIEITSCWANINTKGGFTQPHTPEQLSRRRLLCRHPRRFRIDYIRRPARPTKINFTANTSIHWRKFRTDYFKCRTGNVTPVPRLACSFSKTKPI
jgi:hypothetical protein